MKHILTVIFLFLLFVVSDVAFAQRRELRVTAQQAAVYDAPRSNAEILGRLPRGRVLFGTGRIQGDWLEMEAPPEISGWIFGELLRGDVVEASSVRIRSGAGVGFEGLGTLTKGDRITRRGVQSGWVAFEGIPAMRVWMERSMVSAPAAVDLTAAAPPAEATPSLPAAPPRAAPRPSPAPAPVVASPPVIVPRPEPPAPQVVPSSPPPRAPVSRRRIVRQEPAAALPLIVPREPARRNFPIMVLDDREGLIRRADALLPHGFRPIAHMEQKQIVQIEGIVRPVGVGLFRPAAYRLTTDVALYPRRTVAYLLTDGPSLESQVGRKVRLAGVRYWLLGVREPVIVVAALQ